MIKKVFFIINPASGKSEPILNTFYNVLNPKEIKWDVGILQGNKISDLLDRAQNFNADVVGIYGGDGTVSAVAQKTLNRDILLLALPGGTANVLTSDFGFPNKLKECLELLLKERSQSIEIDMASINDQYFILNTSLGFTDKVMEQTGDQAKSRYGMMAYITQGIKVLVNNKKVNINLEVDGKKVQTDAFSCMICNASSLGTGKIKLPSVKYDDGFLDVFLIKKLNFKSLSEKIANSTDVEEDESVLRFRAKKIKLSSNPPQSVQYDGEILHADEYNIEIIPKAVKFLIAPEKLF